MISPRPPNVRNVLVECNLDMPPIGDLAAAKCDVDGLQVELRVVRLEDRRLVVLFSPGGPDLSDAAKLAVERVIKRIVQDLIRNLGGDTA